MAGPGHQKLVERFPILILDTSNNKQLQNVPKLFVATHKDIANVVAKNILMSNVVTLLQAIVELNLEQQLLSRIKENKYI